MRARVDDHVLWAAVRDGLRDPALGSTGQWAAVAEYAAGRGADPSPHRARELAALLGCVDTADGALAAASDALRADRGPSAARELLVGWLAEDVETAAPLMGAFTSHDTAIDHADVPVSDTDRARLESWLSAHAGAPVAVVEATVIGGGFSRRMWRVRLGDGRSVIVRIEQGGMFGTDTASEVAIMQALHDAGHSVPRIELVDESGEALGQPAFVMEQVPGAVRIDDAGLDDIIRSVAALHAVPVDVVDGSGRSAPEVIEANIERLRSLYRQHSPEIPLLEHAAAWLAANLRPTGPSVIVHGDAGPGNALFDAERGLTTIDWEFAHVGDAAEDWAYLAVIRGRRIMDADAWKQRLRDVAGVAYSPEQWRTWLAFMHFRGACVNVTARTVFERGPLRSADQLAIGVAVHLRSLSQLVEITCA
jgi:aminoglycoside phosphotransferase (APT) family kinase protein